MHATKGRGIPPRHTSSMVHRSRGCKPESRELGHIGVMGVFYYLLPTGFSVSTVLSIYRAVRSLGKAPR